MDIKLLPACLVVFTSLFSMASLAISNDEFKTSFEAARQGEWGLVNEDAEKHVLAPYIEYHRLKSALPKLSVDDVKDYVIRNEDTPLAGWLRRHATLAYGAARQWNDVLALRATPPGDVPSQCIWYRAQLVKDQQKAFEGGFKLWLSGESRPPQCDDLFKAMITKGEITDNLIWQRSLLALQRGNRSLSMYLMRKLKGDEWKAPVNFVHSALKNPAVLAEVPASVSAQVSTEDVVFSVAIYLTPRKIDDIAVLLPDLKEKAVMSTEQINLVQRSLAARSYTFDREDRPKIIDTILGDLGDADLIGPVLRDAIAASDWQAVLGWIEKIQGDESISAYHQYWRARALEQTGNEAEAQKAYSSAAQHREFYGFLAAEKLAQPYILNPEAPNLPEGSLDEVSESSAIERIAALWAIGEEGLAVDEWDYTLRRNPSESGAMAELALVNHWPALAVQATIRGKHWNYIGHRFPLAYQDEFRQSAAEYSLDPLLLMSIARRESAFNSHARSPVGARGLMQMMPATAKQVAREKAFTLTDEKALLDSDVNIHLATYYVSSLLEKYNGNLIAALAGYNAGPHKVDRWLESAPVTFDQFIESIPYRETREYVKAVLAYRVIFNTLQGTEVSAVLNPDERSFAQFISSAELQTEGPVTN